MSATFYPAKQDLHTFTRNGTRRENIWTYVKVPYEVNMANINAYTVLDALGMNPHFEDASPKDQPIEDFIVRCHEWMHDYAPNDGMVEVMSLNKERYILHKVSMLLAVSILGKQNGATHWYFA